MHRILCVFLCIFLSSVSYGQILSGQTVFSRKDSLRGSLRPERTCYDVKYYHLNVHIDPESKSLTGSNTIFFKVVQPTRRIQLDLFEHMDIKSIHLGGNKQHYTREHDAVFVELASQLQTGGMHTLAVEYQGEPQAAKRPPWDGGFVWATDSVGNPWIAVTCQGTGASLWWPCKDHQSDEPDSMMICVEVPEELENVSNGRLRGVTKLKDGYKRYDWFVGNPINSYNVTVNIGKFAHFCDVYVPHSGDTLTLDYYVMPNALKKARQQFLQVKSMMDFFYRYFGPYPFVNDGYKLVQSPHLGMEHQSAVAYGNGFVNGYLGRATSEVGLRFDFIILHESAHEWWGNSITSNDIADMWVHESFGAYAEGLYVEHMFGYEQGMKYINGKKQNVKNDSPIVGPYGVNHEGSGDMYDKGQLVLNTLRHVLDNDSLWFGILKRLNSTYRHQSIDGKQIFDFISAESGMNLEPFFEQYFKNANLPELVIMIEKSDVNVSAIYRWNADVKDFLMPIKVTTGPGKMGFIYPTTESFQRIDLDGLQPDKFKIAEDQFFVDLSIRKVYRVPK
jgi:aminopeptidase N